MSGRALIDIVRSFGLSYESLRWHYKHHLQKSLQRHAEANRDEVRYGSRLQEQLEYISGKAQEILDAAQRGGQLTVAIASLKELRECSRLAALACGELEGEGNRTTVAIQVNQGDTVRNVRAYLNSCGLPLDLTEQVMTYITTAEGGNAMESATG